MESTKPKRQLTPEQLERLAKARENALAVRREKGERMRELKSLEKKAQEKELSDKIESLKQATMPLPPPESVEAEEAKAPIAKKTQSKKPKKKADDVIRAVVESSDESGSESDEDNGDLIKSYLRQKYRTKYKERYNARSLQQLTRGVAQQTVRKKLDDEMMRLASASIFG